MDPWGQGVLLGPPWGPWGPWGQGVLLGPLWGPWGQGVISGSPLGPWGQGASWGQGVPWGPWGQGASWSQGVPWGPWGQGASWGQGPSQVRGRVLEPSLGRTLLRQGTGRVRHRTSRDRCPTRRRAWRCTSPR